MVYAKLCGVGAQTIDCEPLMNLYYVQLSQKKNSRNEKIVWGQQNVKIREFAI